jgi:hypothetical protein
MLIDLHAPIHQIASPLDTASSNNHDRPKCRYYY